MSDPGTYREDYAAMSIPERRAQEARLRADLERHPGTIANRRWQTMERSLAIWQTNTAALLGLLIASEQSSGFGMQLFGARTGAVDSREVRQRFYRDLDVGLFNMIASAVALVDRTMGMKVHYAGTAFLDEFEARNGVVRDLPVSKFLRKFRNYLLHAGQAPTATRMSASQASPSVDVAILLDSRALLNSGFDWGQEARAYLEANADGIKLSAAVEDYRVAMSELFEWLWSQYTPLHGDHVAGANDLIGRIRLTVSGGVPIPERFPVDDDETAG